MKTTSFAELNNKQLASKLLELKKDLFNLRFKHASGQLENGNELTECRKNIARVKTLIRQRELGFAVEPDVAAPEKGRRKRAK